MTPPDEKNPPGQTGGPDYIARKARADLTTPNPSDQVAILESLFRDEAAARELVPKIGCSDFSDACCRVAFRRLEMALEAGSPTDRQSILAALPPEARAHFGAVAGPPWPADKILAVLQRGRELRTSKEESDPPVHPPAPPPDEPPILAAPVGRPLGELVRHTGDDPGELLRHRYLCRGSGLLLAGPTGIGKSSLAMQAMILWGIGRECFGIEPVKPLRSLLIQAENDDGDLAEMRDGVMAGLNLTEAERRLAMENIIVAREDTRTGIAFFAGAARPLLEKHRPDLLWIDPVLAYLGGESNSQKDVGGFLRNMLNPLLREFNCGAVLLHHCNKPPTGREKPDWAENELAYLGAGSAEWANWPRAVLALRSLGSHSVFELRAGKRGGRLGWTEADGETKAYAKLIGHAKEPGVICWREVDPDELAPAGRPKSYTPEELIALLPPEGLATGDWQKSAKAELGLSESTFHRERRELAKSGKIHRSVVLNKWQPVKAA